jgi:hypothetical protein
MDSRGQGSKDTLAVIKGWIDLRVADKNGKRMFNKVNGFLLCI